ncbi:BTB/POZ protein [Nemania abortiva]|nr:BTB/POZ protein [Nemania abortiva]
MGIKRKAAACDGELLETGKFSDITVKCGKRTWNLHRAILTSRCKYFRAALENDKFKEAQDKVIEIHDQDPDQVDWVIRFIYTEYETCEDSGDLEKLINDDATAMDTCVDLFMIADYFALDALCERASDVLARFLICQALDIDSLRMVGQHGWPGNIENLYKKMADTVDRKFVTRFFDVVKRVYNIGSGPFSLLKNALLLYPCLTQCVILHEEPFGDTVFKDPELTDFGLDLLKAMFFTSRTRDLRGLLGYCKGCHFILDHTDKAGIKVVREDDFYLVTAWCLHCERRNREPTTEKALTPGAKRRRISLSTSFAIERSPLKKRVPTPYGSPVLQAQLSGPDLEDTEIWDTVSSDTQSLDAQQPSEPPYGFMFGPST